MTRLASLPDRTFVALLDAAPVALVCIAADGRVVLVNAQPERLFGYKREGVFWLLLNETVPSSGPKSD